MVMINVTSDYTSSVYCNPPTSRSKASRSSELQSLACPGGLADEFGGNGEFGDFGSSLWDFGSSLGNGENGDWV